ncbi:TonB-dependent receptor [Chitinophaga nivalis]|uniref:TonB-dependent receptor n=1 Tax=Chitinophaga nivalis TaxID=2991709 RepID=A0ABT3IRB4_9BACT|nr:TonB-dependent receptor [Chitinophaga nivalis]MCW3463797.1 TonB-dependent receptor [Chitinophaga nivalis]MCW3486513.1 TonB-dependent receptor [Chitinophaga nivalis]
MKREFLPMRINHLKKGKAALLCLLLCLVVQLHAQAQSYLQKQTTIAFSYETISSCLKKLQTKSNINISYNENDVKKYSVNTLDFREAPITQILDQLLKNTDLQYRTMNDGIVIFLKAAVPVAAMRTVTGTVTSLKEKGPVPGASVLVKGTSRGTSTNENGVYTLKVPEDKQVLVISAIGMQSREVMITGEQVDVQLAEDAKTLGSVVVVGYGQVNRKDLTGSISSVKADDLKKMNATSFDAALAGRTAGVHAVKSTGAPGAVASIRIRGGTSAFGNNEPLYVIDGVPIEIGGGQGNEQYKKDVMRQISPLASINPEDIESMDILKDASAAAIYGSRAANGVVIITTKKGRSGPKADISVGYNASIDNFSKQYRMMNADEYRQAVKSAFTAAGTTMPKDSLLYPGVSTDWPKLLMRTAQTHNLYLNINGGSNNGNTLYAVSGSITDQAGVIKYSGFKRYNLRSRLETTVFDRLRLGANMNYSMMHSDDGNAYYNIVRYRPDVPVYDAEGRYGAAPDSSTSNPVAQLDRISNRTRSQNMMMSLFGEVEIVKGLRWRSDLSWNIIKGDMVGYTPSSDVYEMKNNRTGSREDYSNNSTTRIFDNTLTYLHSFGKHHVNAMAGMSFQQNKSDFTNLKSNDFSDDEALNHLGGASILSNYNSGGNISGLQSYFLRANYNFDSKYYFTFTGRTDESTKFSPGYRWAFFPSAALAYRLTSAEFMQPVKWLEDLKLRVSAGKTGSANFSDFQYTTLFASGSYYNKKNGIIVNTVPNPEIRWESTNQLDVAVDFSMFKSKLRGSIGYFKKYTSDMILLRSITMETGSKEQYYNVGDFSNSGWEFQIGSDVIRRKNFSYITDINITRIRSRVEKLNGGFDNLGRLKEGESMGYINGYKTAGIFQNQGEIDALNKTAPDGYYQSSRTRPGDLKFVDINGDGRITDEDQTIIGKAEPDFYGGWNNIVRIGAWEITAFFNFSVGNSLINTGRKDMVLFSYYRNNYAKEMLQDAWSPDNTAGTLPRIVNADPNNNGRYSDFFIEKASFFKLKNLQVSYMLNNPFLQRLRVSNVRVYLTASNLFTFTGYKGLDPEVNTAPAGNFTQGTDTNIYPLTRSFTAGINVNL